MAKNAAVPLAFAQMTGKPITVPPVTLAVRLRRLAGALLAAAVGIVGVGILRRTGGISQRRFDGALVALEQWAQRENAGLTPASIWHLIERTGLQNYVWQVS